MLCVWDQCLFWFKHYTMFTYIENFTWEAINMYNFMFLAISKIKLNSWALWLTPKILVVGRMRQENFCEFKASLWDPVSKKQNKFLKHKVNDFQTYQTKAVTAITLCKRFPGDTELLFLRLLSDVISATCFLPDCGLSLRSLPSLWLCRTTIAETALPVLISDCINGVVC